MKWADAVLTVLATWRLTSLLVNEDGPFGVFAWVRVRFPHGGALSCIWCASVWAAACILVVYRFWAWPVRVLALSAGAILYDKAVD